MMITLIADDGDGNHAALHLEFDEDQWMRLRPCEGPFHVRRVLDITIIRDDGTGIRQPYVPGPTMGDYR